MDWRECWGKRKTAAIPGRATVWLRSAAIAAASNPLRTIALTAFHIGGIFVARRIEIFDQGVHIVVNIRNRRSIDVLDNGSDLVNRVTYSVTDFVNPHYIRIYTIGHIGRAVWFGDVKFGTVEVRRDCALHILCDALHAVGEPSAEAQRHVVADFGKYCGRAVDAQEALDAVHDAACEAFDLICHPASHRRDTAPQALYDAPADAYHHAGDFAERAENGRTDRRELGHKLWDRGKNPRREPHEQRHTGRDKLRQVLAKCAGNPGNDRGQLLDQDRNCSDNTVRQTTKELHPRIKYERQIFNQRTCYEYYRFYDRRYQFREHPADTGRQGRYDLHRCPRQYGQTVQNAIAQQGYDLDCRINNHRHVIQQPLSQGAK